MSWTTTATQQQHNKNTIFLTFVCDNINNRTSKTTPESSIGALLYLLPCFSSFLLVDLPLHYLRRRQLEKISPSILSQRDGSWTRANSINFSTNDRMPPNTC